MMTDLFTPLPPGAVRFHGNIHDTLLTSMQRWNKDTVPYPALVQFFRDGRPQFALGEMWGKAVRSGALYYRYTRDPELKKILQSTVRGLLTTRRENGSISCSAIDAQPDGPGGDLWERKYVLLGLDEYYEHVDQDPAVLQAMCDQLDCTIAQTGPPPKVPITSQGWSPNGIESSSILEPVMRLYNRTGEPRYLAFAAYIIGEGGARGDNLFEAAATGRNPVDMGVPYPKAYEMTSVFEGVVAFHKATGDTRCLAAIKNYFQKVRDREITIVGNGGGSIHFPKVCGEAWDDTAFEQTNPAMDRMMETCTGVTWLKFCALVNRLTADPSAADAIECYLYNGLLGAMRPDGAGFSYINRLNGPKTVTTGWGWSFGDTRVTCCNLNGPMGLATLPLAAALNSATGPVINLYIPAAIQAATPAGQTADITLATAYPRDGAIDITLNLPNPERFTLRLRIPAWSTETILCVNGHPLATEPGTYVAIDREWQAENQLRLQLDMRCRLVNAPRGSDRAGDKFHALVRGPVVLARDENLDPAYNQPVGILSHNGIVDAVLLPTPRLQFQIPTTTGPIQMTDYASVNNWNGTHVQTWLPAF